MNEKIKMMTDEFLKVRKDEFDIHMFEFCSLELRG